MRAWAFRSNHGQMEKGVFMNFSNMDLLSKLFIFFTMSNAVMIMLISITMIIAYLLYVKGHGNMHCLLYTECEPNSLYLQAVIVLDSVMIVCYEDTGYSHIMLSISIILFLYSVILWAKILRSFVVKKNNYHVLHNITKRKAILSESGFLFLYHPYIWNNEYHYDYYYTYDGSEMKYTIQELKKTVEDAISKVEEAGYRIECGYSVDEIAEKISEAIVLPDSTIK